MVRIVIMMIMIVIKFGDGVDDDDVSEDSDDVVIDNVDEGDM